MSWETDRGQDLDLELTLQKGGRTMWSETIDDGQAGDPDEPLELVITSDDVSSLGTEATGALHLDVSTKATVDTAYEIYSAWWYLETSD